MVNKKLYQQQKWKKYFPTHGNFIYIRYNFKLIAEQTVFKVFLEKESLPVNPAKYD